MTINLLTGVPAGLVMLADSMLTIPTPGSNLVTTFENAEKLIPLGAHPIPAAAMISGAGAVNGKLVGLLLGNAGKQVDLANAQGPLMHADVVGFVQAAIDPEWQTQLTLLRGYWAQEKSKVQELATINADRAQQNLPPLAQIEPKHILVQGVQNDPEGFIEVIPPASTIVVATYFDDVQAATELPWPGQAQSIALPNLRWWGSGSVSVARVVKGCDFAKLAAAAEAEAKLPPPPLGQSPIDDAQRAFKYLQQEEQNFQMGLPLASLPLQDAIEFTEYLGMVACGFDKFTVGPAVVGGALDVLAMQPGQREWVSQKRIHSSLK